MVARSWAGLLISALALQAAGGCAKAPASGASGTRLVVNLRFAGPVNDNYQYFLLIRNGNDVSGTNGPVPVILPPYLNGFATSSNPASPTAGFTDFVEYSRVQRNVTNSGYTLYHLPGGINGDPNRDVFSTRGEPDFTSPPNGTNLIRFELALGRIAPDPGEVDPNNGSAPRYLQINVVATTKTPHDPQNIDPQKFVDAFGEQRIGSGSFNAFITIDTAQVGRTYFSTTTPGDPFYEPDNDTYPGPSDPGIELVNWSIQVTQQ